MKNHIIVILSILTMGIQCVTSQNSRERRMILNEYVTQEELVSMSADLAFDKAMSMFSDFSKKFMNKIVVDNTNTKTPIGIDITNKYWLQAFEDVLHANKYWYEEREEYFKVFNPADSLKGGAAQALTDKADSTSKVIFRSRDVKISSVFFTVDVVKSLEAGINWSFLYKGDTTQVGVAQSQFGAQFNSGIRDPNATTSGSSGGSSGGQQVVTGFFGRALPAISFSNVSALISFFQSNQLGNVLSGPSIVVSSGKKGKIQVGQDFYINTRDFQGNTIQQVQSAGIIIDVTPTVYEENGIKFINLEVDAQRSTVSGAGSSPIVNKSQAQTFSVLYDGEETIIGGLYTTTDQIERGGVPFLKDLPWWVLGLRYLFGYDKSTVSTQELIILLKADVVPTIEERIANIQKKNANLIEAERARNAKEMEKYRPKTNKK